MVQQPVTPVAAEASTEPPIPEWSVGRILDLTTQHLKKSGSESPRLDAELLLAHVRNCPRIQLYVQYREAVTDPQRSTMRELVRRRAAHEPVAYLIGHREFFSLDFLVTPATLIPRPETEILVLELLSLAKQTGANRFLEIATGSGCIAISAVKNLPGCQCTATDLSDAALAVARENARRLGVDARIDFRAGDLFAACPESETWPLIISNPPYLSPQEIAQLAPDVKDHEPLSALDGGPLGMQILTRLVHEAPARLAPDGWLLCELDPAQGTMFANLLREQGYRQVRLVKDRTGDVRVAVGQRPQV